MPNMQVTQLRGPTRKQALGQGIADAAKTFGQGLQDFALLRGRESREKALTEERHQERLVKVIKSTPPEHLEGIRQMIQGSDYADDEIINAALDGQSTKHINATNEIAGDRFEGFLKRRHKIKYSSNSDESPIMSDVAGLYSSIAGDLPGSEGKLLSLARDWLTAAEFEELQGLLPESSLGEEESLLGQGGNLSANGTNDAPVRETGESPLGPGGNLPTNGANEALARGFGSSEDPQIPEGAPQAGLPGVFGRRANFQEDPQAPEGAPQAGLPGAFGRRAKYKSPHVPPPWYKALKSQEKNFGDLVQGGGKIIEGIEALRRKGMAWDRIFASLQEKSPGIADQIQMFVENTVAGSSFGEGFSGGDRGPLGGFVSPGSTGRAASQNARRRSVLGSGLYGSQPR